MFIVYTMLRYELHNANDSISPQEVCPYVSLLTLYHYVFNLIKNNIVAKDQIVHFIDNIQKSTIKTITITLLSTSKF